MEKKGHNKTRLFFIFGVFILASMSIFLPAGGVLAASNTAGFAWSNQAGWINFGCINCNVITTDTGTAGYAWSPNYGWINLSPSNASCTSSVNCGVKNTTGGVLSGSAWGEKLGWIDFSGVTINNSTGKFTGTANGSIVGTVNFNCGNCNVITDWRPPTVCGDNVCNGAETCNTCPQDCGTCGGGGGTGHYECDYTAQKCAFISGVSGTDTCAVDGDCVCDPHGDFNKDGKVNLTDFSIMMYYWKQVNPSNKCVDLNHDTVVNIKDFSIMLYWWTGNVTMQEMTQLKIFPYGQ